MLENELSFADKVATLCYDHYKHLGKSGKPIKGKEWTLLSGIIIKFDKPNNDYDLKLVSLATGSKCIGRNSMSPDGDVVNDSHAEVLARRCFLRYLYNQIKLVKNGKESYILVKKAITKNIKVGENSCKNCEVGINGRINKTDMNFETYEIKLGVTFHLFSSHIPCGDASIIPMHRNDNLNCNKASIVEKHVAGGSSDGKICSNDINVSFCSKRYSLQFVEQDECSRVCKKLKITHDSDQPSCFNAISNYKDVKNELHNEIKSLTNLNDTYNVKKIESGDLSLCSEEDLNSNQFSLKHANLDLNEISNHNKTFHVKDIVYKNLFNNIGSSSQKNVSFISPDLSETVGNIVTNVTLVCNYDDIHRTGAKCISEDHRQDMKSDGVNYHTIGAVRTKPGRGDPTLSVSCSDKIGRWLAVGIQGALLSVLIVEPIYFSSIIIGAGGPFSKESLYRALIYRTKTEQRPLLLQSQLVYEMSKYSPVNSNAKRPSSVALMWTNVFNERQIEVATHGHRLGTTKKSKDKGRLLICKRELFKLFHQVTEKKIISKSYKDVKQLSFDYQSKWKRVKNNFGTWTEKPSCLLDFVLSDNDL